MQHHMHNGTCCMGYHKMLQALCIDSDYNCCGSPVFSWRKLGDIMANQWCQGSWEWWVISKQ
jgi:hypothetical protein